MAFKTKKTLNLINNNLNNKHVLLHEDQTRDTQFIEIVENKINETSKQNKQAEIDLKTKIQNLVKIKEKQKKNFILETYRINSEHETKQHLIDNLNKKNKLKQDMINKKLEEKKIHDECKNKYIETTLKRLGLMIDIKTISKSFVNNKEIKELLLKLKIEHYDKRELINKLKLDKKKLEATYKALSFESEEKIKIVRENYDKMKNNALITKESFERNHRKLLEEKKINKVLHEKIMKIKKKMVKKLVETNIDGIINKIILNYKRKEINNQYEIENKKSIENRKRIEENNRREEKMLLNREKELIEEIKENKEKISQLYMKLDEKNIKNFSEKEQLKNDLLRSKKMKLCDILEKMDKKVKILKNKRIEINRSLRLHEKLKIKDNDIFLIVHQNNKDVINETFKNTSEIDKKEKEEIEKINIINERILIELQKKLSSLEEIKKNEKEGLPNKDKRNKELLEYLNKISQEKMTILNKSIEKAKLEREKNYNDLKNKSQKYENIIKEYNKELNTFQLDFNKRIARHKVYDKNSRKLLLTIFQKIQLNDTKQEKNKIKEIIYIKNALQKKIITPKSKIQKRYLNTDKRLPNNKNKLRSKSMTPNRYRHNSNFEEKIRPLKRKYTNFFDEEIN